LPVKASLFGSPSGVGQSSLELRRIVRVIGPVIQGLEETERSGESIQVHRGVGDLRFPVGVDITNADTAETGIARVRGCPVRFQPPSSVISSSIASLPKRPISRPHLHTVPQLASPKVKYTCPRIDAGRLQCRRIAAAVDGTTSEVAVYAWIESDGHIDIEVGPAAW